MHLIGHRIRHTVHEGGVSAVTLRGEKKEVNDSSVEVANHDSPG